MFTTEYTILDYDTIPYNFSCIIWFTKIIMNKWLLRCDCRIAFIAS